MDIKFSTRGSKEQAENSAEQLKSAKETLDKADEYIVLAVSDGMLEILNHISVGTVPEWIYHLETAAIGLFRAAEKHEQMRRSN